MYKYFWHLKYKYIKLIETHWKPGLWVIHIQIQQKSSYKYRIGCTYKYTNILQQIHKTYYSSDQDLTVHHFVLVPGQACTNSCDTYMYKYRKHAKPWIGFLPNTLSPCPWVSCMYKCLSRYTCLIAQQNHSRSKVLCVPYPSRSPCCVLLALPWNTTNENPSTDKLSRAIN